MLPEIELLNISKDIQVDNKDIFGDAVVDWLFDVDHTHRFKTKYSSPSAESSIASASTSNNVVKEDNASQASLSKRTSFKTSFRSICSDEVHQVEWGNDGRAVEQEEKGHEDELLPSLRATVSICTNLILMPFLADCKHLKSTITEGAASMSMVNKEEEEALWTFFQHCRSFDKGKSI